MKTTRILLTAVALLLVGASGAQAKVFELTGSTTVTPSAQATQLLADNGVTTAPVGKATAENGAFVFPVVAGFGSPRTYNGLLAHAGGLKFTKGDRSAVLRRFVAVRHRGHAVLLAQIPGLRGGCAHLRRALDPVGDAHPLQGALPTPPVRSYKRAVRGYCHDGRVIVLAQLENLSRESRYNGALLSADLVLSRQAARLLNRVARQQIVSAGAPLGTAESQVTVVRD